MFFWLYSHPQQSKKTLSPMAAEVMDEMRQARASRRVPRQSPQLFGIQIWELPQKVKVLLCIIEIV